MDTATELPAAATEDSCVPVLARGPRGPCWKRLSPPPIGGNPPEERPKPPVGLVVVEVITPDMKEEEEVLEVREHDDAELETENIEEEEETEVEEEELKSEDDDMEELVDETRDMDEEEATSAACRRASGTSRGPEGAVDTMLIVEEVLSEAMEEEVKTDPILMDWLERAEEEVGRTEAADPSPKDGGTENPPEGRGGGLLSSLSGSPPPPPRVIPPTIPAVVEQIGPVREVGRSKEDEEAGTPSAPSFRPSPSMMPLPMEALVVVMVGRGPAANSEEEEEEEEEMGVVLGRVTVVAVEELTPAV